MMKEIQSGTLDYPTPSLSYTHLAPSLKKKGRETKIIAILWRAFFKSQIKIWWQKSKSCLRQQSIPTTNFKMRACFENDSRRNVEKFLPPPKHRGLVPQNSRLVRTMRRGALQMIKAKREPVPPLPLHSRSGLFQNCSKKGVIAHQPIRKGCVARVALCWFAACPHTQPNEFPLSADWTV